VARPFPPIGQLPYLLTLPPYGFYWFVLAAAVRVMPTWFVPAPQPLPEFVTLVVAQLAAGTAGGTDPQRCWSAKCCRVYPAEAAAGSAGKGPAASNQTRIVQISDVPGIEPPVLLAEIEGADDARHGPLPAALVASFRG